MTSMRSAAPALVWNICTGPLLPRVSKLRTSATSFSIGSLFHECLRAEEALLFGVREKEEDVMAERWRRREGVGGFEESRRTVTIVGGAWRKLTRIVVRHEQERRSRGRSPASGHDVGDVSGDGRCAQRHEACLHGRAFVRLDGQPHTLQLVYEIAAHVIGCARAREVGATRDHREMVSCSLGGERRRRSGCRYDADARVPRE